MSEQKQPDDDSTEIALVGNSDEKFSKAEQKQIWTILFLVGVTTILPWNFFMSAYDYYIVKFDETKWNRTAAQCEFGDSGCGKKMAIVDEAACICESETSRALWAGRGINESNPASEAFMFVFEESAGKSAQGANDNEYVKFWNSALSFLTMGTMLLTSVIMSTDWIKDNYSEKVRITKSLMVELAILAINIVLIYMELAVPTFFYITLIIVVAINLFSGIFQTTVFQFCACFPGDLYNAMLQGQAIGGMFANISAVACSIILPKWFDGCTETLGMNNAIALLFFLVAFGIVYATHHFYNQMIQTRMFKYYSKQSDGDMGTPDGAEDALQPRVKTNMSTSKVLGKVKFHLAAVFMIFTVTLAMFPTMVAEIWSADGPKEDITDKCKLDGFSAVFFKFYVLFMFNFGDFIGRKLCTYSKLGLTKENSGPRVFIYSILRVIFYWLFLECNIRHDRSGYLATSDWYFVVVMLAFGVTNGWVGGLAMEFAPSQVENDDDAKGQVGSYTIITLTMGLLAGAALSFGVKESVVELQNTNYDRIVDLKMVESLQACYSNCTGV